VNPVSRTSLSMRRPERSGRTAVCFRSEVKQGWISPASRPWKAVVAALEELGYDSWYYENMEGGHGGAANQEQLAMRTALEYAYFMRMLMPARWDRGN
jgi:prolyl oligopeptidase